MTTGYDWKLFWEARGSGRLRDELTLHAQSKLTLSLVISYLWKYTIMPG